MKVIIEMRVLGTFFLILLQCNLFAQTTHSRRPSKREVDKRLLVDSEGMKYVLDSTQVYLVAFDKNNKILWYTDPWKDNKLKTYKFKRPRIFEMYFVFSELDNDREAIWILYDNTQYGEVDKKTGKFLFLGQE